jgi:anti-sigma factor RsiW
MTHPTDETLNDYVERDLSPAEQVRVATHLDECGECALVVADLQQIVRDASALGPLQPPPHVWERIRDAIDDRRTPNVTPETDAGRWTMDDRRPTRFAWMAAAAALVLLALFTGRRAAPEPPRASQPDPAAEEQARAEHAGVRERVLLIAVGDHLERSQMVLVELAHASTRDELDISAERQLADDLVASNRLYRHTAQQMGRVNVAGLLDELERVLVEVARGPSTVSMQQLADIQQHIESQGILFKVKVIRSEIREQPAS